MSEMTHRKRIGDYLIEQGLIRHDSVDAILALCEERKCRFGEAAVELGLLSEAQLKEVLSYPYKKELIFRLNSNFFPMETKGLLNLGECLEFGVLPLGFKRRRWLFRSKKILNLVHVGLNPSSAAQAWVQKMKIEVQYFQGFPHEFLKILALHYGFKDDELSAQQKVHEALAKVLAFGTEMPGPEE
jgi:hypothetical protein